MGKIIMGKGTRQRAPVSTAEVAMEVITQDQAPSIQTITVEVPVEVVREVIVEVPVTVEVVREVQVPVIVEKIVEIQVPVEIIKEIQVPVERIVIQERVEYIEIPMDISRIRELESKLRSTNRVKYIACAVALIALSIVGVLL